MMFTVLTANVTTEAAPGTTASIPVTGNPDTGMTSSPTFATTTTTNSECIV